MDLSPGQARSPVLDPTPGRGIRVPAADTRCPNDATLLPSLGEQQPVSPRCPADAPTRPSQAPAQAPAAICTRPRRRARRRRTQAPSGAIAAPGRAVIWRQKRGGQRPALSPVEGRHHAGDGDDDDGDDDGDDHRRRPNVNDVAAALDPVPVARYAPTAICCPPDSRWSASIR